jgi:RNA recognition motif-containing protein
MKLYVGNLQYSSSEEELKELFFQFGEVASVNIIKDRHSGESKGFGFVEMSSNADADKAIKGLNGNNFQGRMLKVNQAQDNRSNNSRPSRGNRY